MNLDQSISHLPVVKLFYESDHIFYKNFIH